MVLIPIIKAPDGWEKILSGAGSAHDGVKKMMGRACSEDLETEIQG
jgi:hypothetical protein